MSRSRINRGGTAATLALGVVAGVHPCLAGIPEIRITEYMYSGADGEFIEITNVGSTPIDLTGWSFDDSNRVPGTFPIGSIGVLQPTQSAIITEGVLPAFRVQWSLWTQPQPPWTHAPVVVPDLGKPDGNNYGRNDTIVLYNAKLEVVDRLQYGDQDFPGSIRTQNVSGWAPVSGLGQDDPYAWSLSTASDLQSSYASKLGALGNPGMYVADTRPVGLGMVLTEYMYDGPGGEFLEFTNLSSEPIDMTGWVIDDSNELLGPNGPFDVGALGVVQPGESVIVTEATPDEFRAEWGLDRSVKVVGNLGLGNGNNLGRNDEINIYDAAGELVDRLTYGDEDFPGSIRTQNASGWVPLESLGKNDPYAWVLATVGDAQGSYASAGGDIGNLGYYLPILRPSIPGDLNDDGVVDGKDLALVLGQWGPCAGCVADITGDGVVDGSDLAIVLGQWT